MNFGGEIGVESLPCLCRPLLKHMMKTGDKVSSLNPTEAAELLQFCFQDVYSLAKELPLPAPEAEGQQPLPQADTAGPPLLFSWLFSSLRCLGYVENCLFVARALASSQEKTVSLQVCDQSLKI